MNEVSILEPKKTSASWLTGKHNEQNDSETTEIMNNNSKPKWFEEMIKNAENVSDIIDSTIDSGLNDDLILNLDCRKSPVNLKNSNQIYSKRRNTLNILQTENQNFLNTFSKSAKSYETGKFGEEKFLDKSEQKKVNSVNTFQNDLNESNKEHSKIELLNKSMSHVLETIDNRTIENVNKHESPTSDQNEDFIIPNAPEGKMLKIILKSNWGDENDWVGLNGIEIFDLKTFESVPCSNIKFLNHLDTNPRKLFDGVYRTHDRNHIWECKFDNQNMIEVKIEFENVIQVGLIRIWNYNKSRIYSYRGVKDVIMYLDDVKIFDGEIRKANGELKGNPDEFGDMIVYTIDENNLEQISKNDTSFQELLLIS